MPFLNVSAESGIAQEIIEQTLYKRCFARWRSGLVAVKKVFPSLVVNFTYRHHHGSQRSGNIALQALTFVPGGHVHSLYKVGDL